MNPFPMHKRLREHAKYIGRFVAKPGSELLALSLGTTKAAVYVEIEGLGRVRIILELLDESAQKRGLAK